MTYQENVHRNVALRQVIQQQTSGKHKSALRASRGKNNKRLAGLSRGPDLCALTQFAILKGKNSNEPVLTHTPHYAVVVGTSQQGRQKIGKQTPNELAGKTPQSMAGKNRTNSPNNSLDTKRPVVP